MLRRAAGALVLALLVAAPAEAQRGFFDSMFGSFPSSPSPSPYRGAPEPRSAPVDNARAPAPRKADTPPGSTVLVLGDSMADWLAYGLEDALADNQELGVVRKNRPNSGLVRYEARSETQEWAQAARDIIAAEKPNYIVMMLGLNDRQSIRERAVPARGATANPPAAVTPATPPQNPAPDAEKSDTDNPEQPAIATAEPAQRARAGGTYEFRSERWTELYTKRIDDTIAALKARGVPVFWVGLPSVRGPKSTSEMSYLNELYRARAEKAGIVFVDVWDGFVDEAGRFIPQGPDFEGQSRRLRSADGVHFTKAGARKLAHYLDREIQRVSNRGPVEVALPTAEPQLPNAPKADGPTIRPLAGPVMPLTASGNVTGEELLGGANGRIAAPHVTAARTLINGEAVPAPAGRGDDFAWPRRGVAAFGSDPIVATTTLPLPVMQQPPAQTVVLAPSGDAPVLAAPVRRASAPRAQQATQQPPPQRPTSPFPSFFGSIFR